jgi:hypothetical protein
MEEMRNAYNTLLGKPEGKIPLGRYGRRWDDNIKTDLWKVWLESVDWIHLAQEPVAVSCEHGNKPSGSIEGGEFLD